MSDISQLNQERIDQWASSMNEIMQGLTVTFSALGATIAAAFQPFFEQMQPILQKIHDYYHNAYLEAGACYGDTPAGFERWLKEIGEVSRLRAEAEMILQKQQDAADMRS
jgi:hypothetical protein